jgi:hypothetical protein
MCDLLLASYLAVQIQALTHIISVLTATTDVLIGLLMKFIRFAAAAADVN